MTDNIAKYTKLLLWVLIALSAFYILMLFVNTTEEDTKWVTNSLTYTEVLLYISVGAVVLFSLFNFVLKLISQPKKAIISIVSIVLLLIIVFVAYSSASDEVLNMPTYDGPDNVPGTLKWSGAGLITAYILLALAVLSIIYVEIAKLFK